MPPCIRYMAVVIRLFRYLFISTPQLHFFHLRYTMMHSVAVGYKKRLLWLNNYCVFISIYDGTIVGVLNSYTTIRLLGLVYAYST